MRKPAVAAVVAVSAVLAGGMMLATTAGAETTSDLPDAPSIVVPGMPAIPQLPPDAGAPAVPEEPAPPRPGGDADPAAAVALPAAGANQAGANQAGANQAGASQAGANQAGINQDGASQAGANQAGATQAGANQAGGNQAGANQAGANQAGGTPAAEGPAGVRPAADPRPAGENPAKPATNGRPDKPDTVAAAHQDVKSSQALSSDPGGSVQQQALDLVNEHRRRGGCGNLTVDRRLIVAANRHAADMARRGYFAHEDSHGDRAGERVEDAGYEWSRFGENIARGQDSVFEVVDGWMHSPEHRENIMDCRLHQVGVGLAFADDRTPYWVQDFATPQ